MAKGFELTENGAKIVERDPNKEFGEMFDKMVTGELEKELKEKRAKETKENFEAMNKQIERDHRAQKSLEKDYQIIPMIHNCTDKKNNLVSVYDKNVSFGKKTW